LLNSFRKIVARNAPVRAPTTHQMSIVKPELIFYARGMAGKFGVGLAAAGGALVGSLAGAFVGGELRGKTGKLWASAGGTLLGAFSGAALAAETPSTTCTTTTGAGAPAKGFGALTGAPKGYGAFFNASLLQVAPQQPKQPAPAPSPQPEPRQAWTMWHGATPANVVAALNALPWKDVHPGRTGRGPVNVGGIWWLETNDRGMQNGIPKPILAYYYWRPPSAA